MLTLKKYFIRGLVFIAALFVLIWFLFCGYITINKNNLIEKIKTALARQVKGEVLVGDLQPDFINSFPFFSVRLKNVEIRDSLWQQHHKSFLKAEELFIRLDSWKLLSLKVQAQKIIVENGLIYFYVDEAGRKNLVTTSGSDSTKRNPDLPRIVLKNVRAIYQDISKNKFDDIYFKALVCKASGSRNNKFSFDMHGMVHALGFNILQGSYLREKKLSGHLTLTWDDSILTLKKSTLRIDGHPFQLAGEFLFTRNPHFSLHINTSSIELPVAASLLQKRTEEKMSKFSLQGKLDIAAHINGPMVYKQQPMVIVDFTLKKGNIRTPSADFTKCSFNGRFINEVDKNKSRLDENSEIEIQQFKGYWENIFVTSNKITVSNLIDPVVAADIHSNFQLSHLNELTGSKTVQFMRGEGKCDLLYCCSLLHPDSIPPTANGEIMISQAEIKYLPRNLSLSRCNGKISLRGQDLLIEELNGYAGKTELQMNGAVNNLLSLLNKAPEMLTLHWNVYTPELNLEDFLSYIKKPSAKSIAKASKQSKLFRIADKVDRILKNGTAELTVRAGKFLYKKVQATNLNASISLLQNQVRANRVSMQHAGGFITFSGTLSDGPGYNILSAKADLQSVNIPQLFTSFNNFGQDAITAQNMRGIISANISLQAALTDKTEILPGSLNSVVDFSITNGQLIAFEPVMKISETAFKKRDFSDIRFAQLKNKLFIRGSAISIPTMEIRSNVLALFVEGIYDTRHGTDMSIRVPVSNINKPDEGAVLKNKGKAGLSIHLRAKTESGKLKVSWDPLHKASKQYKTKKQEKN